jgi:hypothetical protein
MLIAEHGIPRSTAFRWQKTYRKSHNGASEHD